MLKQIKTVLSSTLVSCIVHSVRHKELNLHCRKVVSWHFRIGLSCLCLVSFVHMALFWLQNIWNFVVVFVECLSVVPSVLWCCWNLVGRQEGHPACKKTEWWGAGVVMCLEHIADLRMAQLMPLPLTVSCFSKIQIGFTFLVPAHPGSPGQRAFKYVCVCVYLYSSVIGYCQYPIFCMSANTC